MWPCYDYVTPGLSQGVGVARYAETSGTQVGRNLGLNCGEHENVQKDDLGRFESGAV